MTLDDQTVLDTQAALLQRQNDPIHTPPPAHAVGSEVELLLKGVSAQPEIVMTDIRRELTWRIAMTPDPAQSATWSATLRVPSLPTMLHYHFAFEDDSEFYALRQIESLVPGQPHPIFGQWIRRPFQIAVYDPDAMPPTWTRGQIIYQIFPDRFAKGTLDNNGRTHAARNVYGHDPLFLSWDEPPELPPKGRDFYGGNLCGVIDKLDYLKALQVDCLYLTPIFESPSNHRYDAMDYHSIDPLLGTEQDLRDLVEQVHQRGMRIILDGVFNHCCNDSKYFNAAGWYGEDVGAARSRQSPYYRWFDFQEWPDQYTGWAGVRTMPEFVECPEVEEFFLGKNGVSNYWLRTGIDGWRTDVTPWMTDEFWRRFRRSVCATNPEAYLVAEEWNDASHYLIGESFSATMNYRFAWALRGFFALDVLTVSEFDERLDGLRRDTPPPALLSQVNLIDSHDTARALTICGGDKKRFKQMVAFLLAYPGAPMICYGDEVGLQGDYAEASRQPFLWEGGDQELSDFYQQALNFRRGSNALRYGLYETVLVDEALRVFVFARQFEDEIVYAAFNAGDTAAEFTLHISQEFGNWTDILSGSSINSHNNHLHLRLDPRTMAWCVPSSQILP